MSTAIKHPAVPDGVSQSSGHHDAQPERQSARMSKIKTTGLARSGTGCFIAVLAWQQWASKG